MLNNKRKYFLISFIIFNVFCNVNTPNDIIDAITNSTTGDDIQIQSDISIAEAGQAMIFTNKNVMLNLNKVE